MFNKLKQFKDLRSQAKDLQSKLAEETITVSEAGGKVKMTMDGNLKITDLDIDKEMLNPDKKQKLESAIKDAHASATKKMQRTMATKMKEMGGLPEIPGMS
ncbi:MAG: YbaB/EbfC family nucleoid-associated protein [Candidatus Magasanikbacteria bacterium]|nr:YbaB/EbfC family nucleoid-associated protein [Candidatus Magasanikbacteria bacterium]